MLIVRRSDKLEPLRDREFIDLTEWKKVKRPSRDASRLFSTSKASIASCCLFLYHFHARSFDVFLSFESTASCLVKDGLQSKGASLCLSDKP